MPVRVVLTGSECTGKTTLAEKLAAHYKVKFVPEYLRSYFERKKGILTIADVIPIAQGQLQLEREAEEKGYNPVICDTDIISSIVYSKHYFKHCPDWLEEQIEKREHPTYLLCDIDVAWQADGQRDRAEERYYMQSLFIDELVIRNIPYHKISGDLNRRTIDSISIINAAMNIF